MARTVTASAPPTTSNLGPGFDVLGMALASRAVPRDRVTVRAAERWQVTVAGPEAAGVPTRLTDNVVVAAARVLTRTPLHLAVWKGVPTGRGLGSSGASAAAAARAVAAWLRLDRARDWTPAALLRAAAAGEAAATGAPHADNVAPALLGGMTCTPFGAAAPPFRWSVARSVACAIAIPEIRLATRAMRRLVPSAWPRDRHITETGAAVAVATCIQRGELDRLREVMAGSLVEARRAAHIVGFDAVVRAAARAGAAATMVSGSGPTLLSWCDVRRCDPARVADAMVRAFAQAGIAARPATARPGRGALVR